MCRGLCIEEKNQRNRLSQCFLPIVFQFLIHLAILCSVILQTAFLRFLFYLLSYQVLSIIKGELEGKKRREETDSVFCVCWLQFPGFCDTPRTNLSRPFQLYQPRKVMPPPQKVNSVPLSPSLNSQVLITPTHPFHLLNPAVIAAPCSYYLQVISVFFLLFKPSPPGKNFHVLNSS